MIHNSTAYYYDFSGEVLHDSIHFFISKIIPQITSIAVPSFFFISGYLFFRGYSNSMTAGKLRSRVHTLLIPYLINNVICWIYEVVIVEVPFSNQFLNYSAKPLNPLNIIIGLLLGKYSMGWFILALMIYNLLAIPMYYILKHKNTGAVFLILVFLLVYSPIDDFRILGLYYRNDSLFYYFSGGFIGIHYKDLLKKKYDLKQNLEALILFCILVIYNAVIAYMNVDINRYLNGITLALRCILMWMVFDLLKWQYLEKRWYIGLSFFVYLSHGLFEKIYVTICRIVFDRLLGTDYSELIVFVISVLLTMLTVLAIAKALIRATPKLFAAMTGNRVGKNISHND